MMDPSQSLDFRLLPERKFALPPQAVPTICPRSWGRRFGAVSSKFALSVIGLGAQLPKVG